MDGDKTAVVDLEQVSFEFENICRQKQPSRNEQDSGGRIVVSKAASAMQLHNGEIRQTT
jgi:hypothetical protein